MAGLTDVFAGGMAAAGTGVLAVSFAINSKLLVAICFLSASSSLSVARVAVSLENLYPSLS